jgi:predicted Zn-dependent protease
MRRRRGIVSTALVGFVLSAAAACAVNPVSGKRELSLISEQGEIEMGKESDAQIGREYGTYPDQSLTRYVAAVGAEMIPHTHRPKLEYHFAVLDSPVVNAFAAPGGYIYVTRGILAMMNSESELATVLGHELGHVNARHSVRQMSQMILVQAGLALGSAVSETFAKVAGVAGVGAQLLFLKYSRDDEREADALGVAYSRAGGFNAVEMVNFFATLQRYGDLSGGHSLPGFLSTHPLTSERIQNVKGLVGELDAERPTKRETYLQTLDGLVYGDDPRQGYVEGAGFYHPELRFMFLVPSGWKVQNTPSQVTLVPENGDAAILLRTEQSGDDLAAFAQKKSAAIQGWKSLGAQAATINGMASYHQLGDIAQQDQDTLRGRMSFIRKGPQVYYFTALSKAADFNRFDPVFSRVVGSFNDLRDPKYLDRRPRRIALVAADGRRVLKDYLSQENIKADAWPTLAILNGLANADAVPERGRTIKVVR